MKISRVILGPILAVIFLVFFVYIISGVQWILTGIATNDMFLGSVSSAVENIVPPAVAPEISAESAISVWTNSSSQDTILLEKDSQRKLSIASISKLITALVVVDNYNLSQQITISDVAGHQSKDPEPLKSGETFYVKDLLYAMLIGSDNAASYALSESVGTNNFVELMNQKAKELGILNTSFANPTGLGSANVSTAQDLVKIAEYILKNHPSILGITTMPEFDLYTVDGKIIHKIVNTDELLNNSSNLAERIVGGKTGNTPTAGECLLLVTKTLNNNGYLISIVLNSSDRFAEIKRIINWVDASYQWQAVAAFDPGSLNWEEAVSSAPWEARDSHTVVVYKDKLWLMGGLDANGHMSSPGYVDYNASPHLSDVWSSDDGVNWKLIAEKSPWGNRRSVGLVNFKGKIWLMGGYSPDFGYRNDVWSTEDGANWKQEVASATWPAREGHQLVVFQDKIWLIGGVRYDKAVAGSSTEIPGLFNDVWYSSDGINWTEATAHAGWVPRWDHAVTVFQNKLWLVDGMVFGSKMFNDVWYSDDGVNWTESIGNAPFATRQGNFITEYKGKLWVIGRLDGANGGTNDVWYSDDGITWQKTKNNPLWLGREDFGSAIFKDKIWVIGGMNSNWEWTNDVWYSKF